MKLYERIENNNFDEIDRNRAIELIEGGNGHLVYNEKYFKLQKENEEFKRLHIQDNKHLDFIMQHSIPVQKVKDKISERQFELQQEYKDFEDDAILIVLQELLEGRE